MASYGSLPSSHTHALPGSISLEHPKTCDKDPELRLGLGLLLWLRLRLRLGNGRNLCTMFPSSSSVFVPHCPSFSCHDASASLAILIAYQSYIWLEALDCWVTFYSLSQGHQSWVNDGIRSLEGLYQ